MGRLLTWTHRRRVDRLGSEVAAAADRDVAELAVGLAVG